MDKQKEFEKVVREYLALKEDVEIVDIAITIKREDVIHFCPDKTKLLLHTPATDIDNKDGKGIQKRKYKKRTKAKINPYTGQKHRKIEARLDLTVMDSDIEYAKKRLQQWSWTKKFTEEEIEFWKALKGGSIRLMTVEHKDNLINFYNRTAKRMAGE